MQYAALLGAHGNAGALAHTVFSLNISEELGDSPLQDNHFDGRDAFGPQSTIYSLQHLLLLVRRNKYPSFPVCVRLCELPGLVFRNELVLLAHHDFSDMDPPLT